MDPALIEAAITPKTGAIMLVHQLGMPARSAEIAAIAKRHGLPLVEDSACAIGSETLDGNQWQRIGAPFDKLSCFSLHPRKLLSTGDGGMITTDDADLAARLRLLRQHGMSVNDQQRHQSQQVVFEEYVEVGFNYRLTDIQAAIGRCQLARLPQMVVRRRELAELYRAKLGQIDGLTVPADRTDTRTNWQSYCVMLPDGIDQRQVMQAMLDDGIATRRGVMNAHREPAYSHGEEATGVRFPLPVSEKAQDRGLILPMFDEMTEQEVETVSSSLANALRRQRAH